MLSSRVYNELEKKPLLYQTDQKVASASGYDLSVIGKTSLNISLGNIIYNQNVIVADLSLDGVIGLDFMKTYDCTIDIKKGNFQVGGKCYKVELVGSLGCFRITSKEVVNIPARSEFVTYCNVIKPDQCCQSKDVLGLIEPSKRFLSSGKALVARTVGYIKDGEIPVRMMNPSFDHQTVYPGTFVATLSTVDTTYMRHHQFKIQVVKNVAIYLLTCTTFSKDLIQI